jgi:hypothetical protein
MRISGGVGVGIRKHVAEELVLAEGVEEQES